MNELRPNEQRAKAAIALIWLILALDILTIVFELFQYYLIQMIENGEDVSEIIAYIVDYGVLGCGTIYIMVAIISIITFIRWFRRAYFNLKVISYTTDYNDGWAAGAWFIPIMNLFVPYKIMKELYVKTDHYLLLKEGYTKDKKLKTSYVGWWWALWIISTVITRIYFRIQMKSSFSLDEDSTIFFSVITTAVAIILAIVTIIVINDYSEAETLLYQIKEEGEEDDDYDGIFSQ